MSRVRVALLGVPVIERDSVPVHVDTRKATALLAYLAHSAGPQSRDALAAILWSELDAAGARAALRRTLSTLRTALGDSGLESDREIIRLQDKSPHIDVRRFRAALGRVRAHCHSLRQACAACLLTLREAVTLYRRGIGRRKATRAAW